MLNHGSQAPGVSAQKPLTLVLITAGKTYLQTNAGQIWLLQMNETRMLRPQVEEDTYHMSTQGIVLSTEKVTFTSLYQALIHCFRFEYQDEYKSSVHWYEKWTEEGDHVNAKEAKRYAELYARGVELLDKLSKETNRGFRKKQEKEVLSIITELEAPMDEYKTIIPTSSGSQLVIIIN